MRSRRQTYWRRVCRRPLILPRVDQQVPVHEHPHTVIRGRGERRRPRRKIEVPRPARREIVDGHSRIRRPRAPVVIHRRLTPIQHRRPRQPHIVEIRRLIRPLRAGRSGADVREAPDRAAIEVDVEQIAAGAGLDVHRVRSTRHDRLKLGWVGLAVRPERHRPDAVARVIGEEQPSVERARIRPCAVERYAADR